MEMLVVPGSWNSMESRRWCLGSCLQAPGACSPSINARPRSYWASHCWLELTGEQSSLFSPAASFHCAGAWEAYKHWPNIIEFSCVGSSGGVLSLWSLVREVQESHSCANYFALWTDRILWNMRSFVRWQSSKVGTQHPLEQLGFASWTRDGNHTCLWKQLCPENRDIWWWAPECNAAYFWEKSYNSSAGALLLLGEGKGSEMLVSTPALWLIVPLSVIYLLHRCIFGKYILCLGDPRWVAMKALGVWRCSCLSPLPNTLTVLCHF